MKPAAPVMRILGMLDYMEKLRSSCIYIFKYFERSMIKYI